MPEFIIYYRVVEHPVLCWACVFFRDEKNRTEGDPDLSPDEARRVADHWNHPVAPRCALCLEPVLPTESVGDDAGYPYSCGCSELSGWSQESYKHLVRETLRDQQETTRTRRERKAAK